MKESERRIDMAKKTKSSSKKKITKSKKNTPQKMQLDVFSEIVGISLIGMALLIVASVWSDKVGLVGEGIRSLSVGLFGIGGYMLPLYMIYVGVMYMKGAMGQIIHSLKYMLPLIAILVVFFHLLSYGENTTQSLISVYYMKEAAFYNGGWIGAGIGYLLLKGFGLWGSYILLMVALGIWLLVVTQFPFFSWMQQHLAVGVTIFTDSMQEIHSKRKGEKAKSKKGHTSRQIEDVRIQGEENATEHPPIYINHAERQSYEFGKDFGAIEEVELENEPVILEPYKEREEQKGVQTLNKPNKNDRTSESEDLGVLEESLDLKDEAIVEAYQFPSIELLAKSEGMTQRASSRSSLTNAKKLEDTLASFGVEAKVTQINKGPTVTRYELQPKQGVKVSKIVNLADDIALNLAASGIRIEAPIPGKAAVGIEVPNDKSEMVYLREVIASDTFTTFPSKLAFALGKDIAGKPIVTDIAKMPHMLIAGATGSGKSVCINTLITSIIYKAKPSEVKLIMIDPKVVELNVYNGIPHLLIPVVTDPKKAAGALAWAVNEMTKRYQLFADNNVRDMKGYNIKMVDEALKMPSIIIIIDELADLMMTAAKEVEDAICRLAQMARAAGIHLVIATQRPSVDVITGVIKANIPSRLAFAVSSGIDSRTILDSHGAEKLLGKGDMLFCPIGESKPIRIQGAFISDKEVESIVEWTKQTGQVQYEEAVIESISQPTISIDASGEDELIGQAVQLAKGKDKLSISMLQRYFRIGFNRASRLMEALEARGIVGPDEGSKPRKVLQSGLTDEESIG